MPDEQARATAKEALLLAELGGSASVPVLTAAYFRERDARGWPDIQPYSVARRMSELRGEGRVVDTGGRVMGPNGRNVAVWEVAPWRAN